MSGNGSSFGTVQVTGSDWQKRNREDRLPGSDGSSRTIVPGIDTKGTSENTKGTKKDEEGTKVTYICFGNEESCEEENNYTSIEPRKKRESGGSDGSDGSGEILVGKSSKNVSSNLQRMDKCYLLKFESTQDKVERLFELLTLIGSCLYILQALKELKRLGMTIFLQTWSAVPGRVMFMLSCALVVASLPLRFLCEPRIEDRLIAAAMFLTPMHFLFFCR